ncbi:4471_t:CDS:1, partial [Entrophospora sp. SA101]
PNTKKTDIPNVAVNDSDIIIRVTLGICGTDILEHMFCPFPSNIHANHSDTHS